MRILLCLMMVLGGCTTVTSESKFADGSSNIQTVRVPPLGKSDIAKFNTETITPMEGGGEMSHKMSTGASGSSGSDLEAAFELLGLLTTRLGNTRQPEAIQPNLQDTANLDQLNQVLEAMFKKLEALERP